MGGVDGCLTAGGGKWTVEQLYYTCCRAPINSPHRMLLLLLTRLLIYLGPTATVTRSANPPLTSLGVVVRVETQRDLGILAVVAV